MMRIIAAPVARLRVVMQLAGAKPRACVRIMGQRIAAFACANAAKGKLDTHRISC